MLPSARSLPPRVGIEKIWAYPCTLSLDLAELGRVRGHEVADLHDNLLVRSRSLNPMWEDPVTMAVNAARPLVSDADRAAIELVIVATESGVDQGKSISTFVQRWLDLQPNCRVFEAKQACYGGTSAVMMAASWVASGIAPGAKALVIATDQSRMSLNEPYEYVMGAGAVAMLISDDPRVLEIELQLSGYFTAEVFDTFRPTTKVETGNGEASLYCYLDALEGALAHFQRRAGNVELDTYFKRFLYHVPFGGITFQAHRTLLRQVRRMKKSEAWEHFCQRSRPGLVYNAQMGGTYSGSTFLALMGLVDSTPELAQGDRIAIFSYGSGSCGEFWSGVVGPEARQRVAAAELQGLLDRRQPLSVPAYEALERERYDRIDCGDFVPDTSAHDGLYERRYRSEKLLTLKKIADHYREYGWA